MAQSTPSYHIPGLYAHDNPNRGPALLGGSVTLIAAASIAVMLRLVARRIKRVSWAADDYLSAVALVFAYAMFTAMVFCIKHGLGQKRLTNIAGALQASKWLYIFEALFPVTTIATKLSILCLYRRIFTTFNKTFAWALYTVGALQVGWAVSGFFTTVFQCWPINILWRLEGGLFSAHPAGHCIDLVASLTGLAVINTVLNTALLVLPMPMVWNLHTSQKHKIALTFIFALGCADISASIARTYLTSRAINDPSTILWRQAPAVILSFAEPCVGIVCACLPAMRPLLPAAKTLISKTLISKTTFFSAAPSSSSWIRLRGGGKSSSSAVAVNRSGGSGGGSGGAQQVRWEAGKEGAGVEKGFVGSAVHHGGRFDFERRVVDEEQARGKGIVVKTEMNQCAVELGTRGS